MIFYLVFIILTIMHPISDFIVRNITWGKWYCDLLHYGLSLNPLHFLVDITIGKIHPRYYTFLAVSGGIELIEKRFWLFLGFDQLAHVIMNIVFAVFIEMILI